MSAKAHGRATNDGAIVTASVTRSAELILLFQQPRASPLVGFNEIGARG
jgi:hypothetical protein